MTSRDRIWAALEGKPTDHVPLTTWCFGLPAPPHLRWDQDGVPRDYWYSLRMEHIHTTATAWTVEDDFRRVLAWQSVGVDDVLDVSVPWSASPEVRWEDCTIPPGGAGPGTTLVREYRTPAGSVRHAVRVTDPDPPGWPIQPAYVALFEDLNIPRAVEHVVSEPQDVEAVPYLYGPPDTAAQRWLAESTPSPWAVVTGSGFERRCSELWRPWRTQTASSSTRWMLCFRTPRGKAWRR